MQRAAAPLLATLFAMGGWLGCGTLVSGGEPAGPIAARIGDEVITVAELDASIKDDLFERETSKGNPSRTHEVRSQALKRMIEKRVLEREAERRGISRKELLAAESAALGAVSDEDVERFYQENASQLRGATLEQVRPQIRAHLENERQRKVVDTLVTAAGVSTELERPRVVVDSKGPALGPADARVTIVEFSDFQCPYCRRATPVLRDIVARYPDQVRIVYRHMPIDGLHPRARASAEASACAAEGNRFWEFHDIVFENPANLGDDDLRGYAAKVGLDAKSFDECFRSRRHAGTVQADEKEAARLGITGTPAFVVNGVLLFGLHPAEAFDEIIRDELGLPPAEPAS